MISMVYCVLYLLFSPSELQSNIDFVPEVHATCRVRSSSVNIADGISGVLTVEQCNMAIQSISVGIVQNEQLSMHACIPSSHMQKYVTLPMNYVGSVVLVSNLQTLYGIQRRYHVEIATVIQKSHLSFIPIQREFRMIGKLIIHAFCFHSVLKSFSAISFTASNTCLFTFPGEMSTLVCCPVMPSWESI